MKRFGIEIRKANTIGNIYKDVDRVLANIPIGSVNKEIQIQAVAHALQKMIKVQNYFDVCTIDSCIKIGQIHISSERRDIYHSQHCINWNEMTDEFRTTLIAMVLDDFRNILNPQDDNN